MKSFFSVSMVWLALASASGFAAPFSVEPEKPLIQDFEEKIPFNLSIDNSNGPCLLVASKDEKVHLRATTLYKESFAVEVAGFGTDQATISVAYPEKELDEVVNIGPGPIPPSRSVKLEIAIPVTLLRNLTVETKNGDIVLRGSFAGELAKERVLTATTVNGGITAKDFSALGGATLKTSNGSVTANKLNGALSLTTTNGSIEVDGGTGNINALTKNGGIRVVNRIGDSVEAGTLRGAIFFNNPKVKKENAASSGHINYTPSNAR